MEIRTLGKSGLRISAISFGAGPISGLMVGKDHEAQRRTVKRAIELGINWFDTAATYGDGDSERSLGAALSTSKSTSELQVATKFRLRSEELDDIPAAIRSSLDKSCRRMGLERVTLFQLHNSITSRRGDLPTSISVHDVLEPRGVVDALEQLRNEGLIDQFGFTALGDTRSLNTVIRNGRFTAAQVPLNLLTLISGADRSSGSVDVDYEHLVDDCGSNGVGVIAIRVFAGGALVGQAPSPYTYKTKFFPLDLFQRDQLRAERLVKTLRDQMSSAEAAVRFVLGNASVSTALIGFASPEQIEQVIGYASKGPLEDVTITSIANLAGE